MTTVKPRVHLLTTGGTIASVSSGEGGANPLLQGHDLLAAVPGVEDWADIAEAIRAGRYVVITSGRGAGVSGIPMGMKERFLI